MSVPPAGYPSATPLAGRAAPGVQTAPVTFRSWQPGILALRPLGFGDFLTVPFRAFTYARATVVGGPTVMTLLSAAATGLATWLFFTDPLLGIMDFESQFSGIQPLTVVAIVLAGLSWFAVDMLANAIVLIGISRAVLGEKVTFGTAWKQLVPRIPQLLLLYLLTGAVFVISGLLGSVLMFAGAAAESPGLTGLGVLALYGVIGVAAVFLGVYLPAARGAVVMERVRVVAGVRRSFAIMKQRFWWTVLILFVVVSALGVISNVIQFVGIFGGGFVAILVPESEWAFGLAAGIAIGLTVVLSNVITYAYLGSVNGLIYIDGRMRREGFDVELARAAESKHLATQVVAG